MSINRALLILVLFISTYLAAVSEALGIEATENQPYQKVKVAARETLWAAITSGHGSGATVAIMDNGEIVYSEGIGVKDRSMNSPVDRSTRFNIGSTSKMFAAVAILMLVDEGRICLDESVTKYIPDFRMKDRRYKDITVRMLFNHSSGLPGSSFYFSYRPYYDMHEILLETLADAYLKHRPGAMSMYCNDGFTLAEIIVERVSGKKYLDFLNERIFEPLAMKNTGASVGEIQDTDVAEYYEAETGRKYPPEAITVYGAGGISSTAEDLCRFGSSFTSKGEKILSEASLSEIRKTQPTYFSGKLKDRQMMSEFGWEYTRLSPFDKKGIQVLGKGGNSAYYSTNLQILPDHGIVIALSISGHAIGEALTRPILDSLMQYKNLAEPEKKQISKPPTPQQIPDELMKYAGFYAGDSETVKLVIDRKNKRINLYTLYDKDDREKEPLLSFIYNNGYLFNSLKKLQCYLTTIEGRSYLVFHKVPDYGVDMLLYQKLDRIREPQSLKIAMDEKTWLLRNAKPYVLAGSVRLLKSCLHRDLPGYIDFGGIKKIESPTFAGIAATCFRDQTELYLINRKGEWWAKSGNNIFTMADSVGKAVIGVNKVTIGADGCNEWLRIGKEAILSFEKPEEGRIIVLNDDAVLFDSIVDSDEVFAPKGSFVFCAASAGSVFKIRAR